MKLASKSALKNRYGKSFDADGFINERMTLYGDLVKTQLKMKQGCLEVLEFLKKNGIPCAIATSTSSELTYSNLERINILHFFDAVVTGSMVEKSKLDPAVFIKAGNLIGADFQQCIVCEDSYSGIEAAYRSGMKAVFIPDRQTPNDMTDQITYATLNSMLDVIELIKKENNIK